MPTPDPLKAASPALAALLEEDVEDLYENAPCGYLSTLLDGTIARVNTTALAWTGYRRDELVARRTFHDLLAPGDRIYYETHYAPLLHMQGFVREIAVDIVRSDGSHLPALLNSVLRRAENGDAAVIRTTIFDATERRRYERELVRARRDAERRARAAAALAHVSDGVVVVDTDGRITLTNDAAAAVLGLGEGAAGRQIAEAVPGWDEISSRIPVGTAQTRPAAAIVPLHGDAGEQWLSIVGVVSGEGTVLTIRDVTRERRLDELRDELVTTVSHELRTPLTGVYGAAQTLRSLGARLTDAERDGMLATIVEQSERLTAALDAVLVTSRLDREQLELSQGHFGAVALARDVAAGLSHTENTARIKVDGDASVLVRGDERYTAQALRNLIDNALRYSPPDSVVRVSVTSEAGRVRLTVADDGPGVPPADRERIFERFHRVDPALRQGPSGIGLGLYVARELVERMGGRLELATAAPGATFVIELPLAPVGGGEQ